MFDFAEMQTAKILPFASALKSTKPSISVVGLGCVGAVSTACFSSLGHRVIGVDLNRDKIERIAVGKSPIHERDLERFLMQGVADNLIATTDDLAFAVRETNVTFVSVGAPITEDDGCDYRFIESAARSIGVGLAQKNEFHVVVLRSSVPPGTTMKVMIPILEQISGKKAGLDFGVAYNPEFLREGVAVADFYAPPKTVLGCTDLRTAQILKDIYKPIDDDVMLTTIETAEMVKYVENVWNATKVTVATELDRLCKPLGEDNHSVIDLFV